jgi:hypothetical protein
MRGKFDLGLRALIVANIVVVGALAFAMAADWLQISTPDLSGASPAASPSASIETMEMGLAHIPTSAECTLCHETGGSGGLRAVPALGHPLAGWTECLTCHTNEKLGQKAPGHAGIAQTECLNCHKEAPQGPAITQAHANLNKPCLDCHGTIAHLPSTMAGRDPNECWLCHKPLASPPPQEPHPNRSDLTCRDCHQAADVGALPIDHALRSDATCVLCHEMNLGQGASPAVPASPASPATPSSAPSLGPPPEPSSAPIEGS